MGFITGTETTVGATFVGAIGGAIGSMGAVAWMMAAQLMYYKKHSKEYVPVLSNGTAIGMRVRLIPMNGGEPQHGTIESITNESLIVQFDPETNCGTQEIPRGYWDRDAKAHREKGQAWYEGKKAYLKANACTYEGQACVCGTMLGVFAADGIDECISGGAVHPCDVFPDALCAGCLCMCCIHGTRLACKAREDKMAKEQREATQRANLNYPQGDYARRGVSLEQDDDFDDEPVMGKPLAGATRGSRGVAAGSYGGGRSQLSTSTVRRTRGVAQNLGQSALDDPADDAWAWEERNRRSQISEMFKQGGRPDDEANRHLFEQRPRGEDSQVSGAGPRRGRERSLPSMVSGDTADMQSQSHVSYGQSYVSEPAPARGGGGYGDGSGVGSAVPPASPPKSGVRLGVGGGTGWSDY